MQKLKTRVKKLISDGEKTVGKRERYYISKPESWQDGDNGAAYYEKTEALREGVELLKDGLNYFPNL